MVKGGLSFDEYIKQILDVEDRQLEKNDPEPICIFAPGECYLNPDQRHEACYKCEFSKKAHEQYLHKYNEAVRRDLG